MLKEVQIRNACTYHTGLKFFIAICTADWRCGCGSMNRSGLTFPLACGMMAVGVVFAIQKTVQRIEEEALEDPQRSINNNAILDDGIPAMRFS